ncbi:MAG: tRNA1(Val) (adenine(37)-N6)-methyltransferase [Gudongella sp.]|nr:tRNA1(Val) (adenine(37)-N6)-methyltransferase [Gudongella sp.]
MERLDIVPGTTNKIYQDREMFSYGVDAILLSWFAKPKGTVLDLGTGTGIIPLRIAADKNVEVIYGVEIQERVAQMAEKSVYLNKLDDRIKILNTDIKKLPLIFAKASADTIITNPPYMKSGSALVNPSENHAYSRHEIACTLEDIVEVSAVLLKPLGKIFMVHRPNRLVDVLCAMRENGIEPKRICWVYPKPGKPSNLFLIEGVKDGKRDFKCDLPVTIYDKDGNYNEEIYDIYGIER